MNRQALVSHILQKGSFLCVGIDPDPAKLPAHLQAEEDGILKFCKAIVDATRAFAVAYKPNTAFFEAHGAKGWTWLSEIVHYIGKQHFIIADAKRGDIGNTSRMYAKAFFETLPCDAITIAPYMGSDSVQPFLQFPEKWAVVLALTSNAGAIDFQMEQLALDGRPLYQRVLQEVASWGSTHNLMFVVGATRPEMFAQVREVVPHHFLLVPGVGAQGGSLTEVCRYGLNKEVGLLVNASRSILYASPEADFAEAAAQAAAEITLEMRTILKENFLL